MVEVLLALERRTHEHESVVLRMGEPELDVAAARFGKRVERRLRRLDGTGDPFGQLHEHVAAHRDEHRLLVLEVTVDRRWRDAHPLGDGADRHGCLVVGLVEQLADRGEDLLTELVSLAAARPDPRCLASRSAGPFQRAVVRRRRRRAASSSSRSTCSENPKRLCKRRSGAGAHQLASPARRMNAGTSVERIRKASTSTASIRPMPNIFMNDTWPVAKARNTTAISTAAAVTIRPVRSSPIATDVTVSEPLSCSSLIRDRRNTS